MHVGRIISLISHLENTPPENFNMSLWFSKPGEPWKDMAEAQSRGGLRRSFSNWCGTAACIAGHCNVQRKAKKWYGSSAERQWLGLTMLEASTLFTPWGRSPPVHSDEEYRRVHKNRSATYDHPRALNTLRNMVVQHARTGKTVVDWDAPPVSAEAYAAALAPPATTAPLPESLTSLLRPEPKTPAKA